MCKSFGQTCKTWNKKGGKKVVLHIGTCISFTHRKEGVEFFRESFIISVRSLKCGDVLGIRQDDSRVNLLQLRDCAVSR